MRHLTVSEAAKALNLSVPTIKRYIYEGVLNSVKLPGGQHRIPQSEIDRLLSPDGGGAPPQTEGTIEQRLLVLENWITELAEEVERLGAALQVLSRFCAGRPQDRCDTTEQAEAKTVHDVVILGPGCKKCEKLYELTSEAVKALGETDTTVRHVTDLDEIAEYGPVLTPALVVDGEVVLAGRVPSPNELKNLLRRHLE